MTTVTYNGVELRNVHTKEWSETIVYDSSNTDQIGRKFSLTFDAVIHNQAVGADAATARLGVFGGAGGATNAAERFNDARYRLMQPRKSLVVRVGSTPVLVAHPNEATRRDAAAIDIDNGPRPVSCEVYSIASDRVFRIRWKVEVMLTGCLSAAGAGILSINNRWAVRESMDANFALRRTVTGALRIAAGAPGQSGSLIPHLMRRMCWPGLEDGFRRDSIDWSADPSGLILQYVITDVQSRYAAPYPATRMSGRHSIQTNDGITFFQEVAVHLEGGPHSDVGLLLERATQVCQYRLNFEAGSERVNEDERLIVNAEIVETIGDTPAIDMVLRVREIGGPRMLLTRLNNARMGTMSLPPAKIQFEAGSRPIEIPNSAYQVNKHPVPEPYGWNEWSTRPRDAAALAFLQCVLQTPCGGAPSIGSPPSTEYEAVGEPTAREETDTEINQYPEGVLPDPASQSTWSNAHTSAMYVTVTQGARYQWQRAIAQLPIARPETSNQPTSSLVRLCAGQSARAVTIDVERLDALPQIEPWVKHKLGQVNFEPVFLDLQVLPARRSATGGRLVYRARCQSVFLADRELSLTATVPIGQLPTEGAGDLSNVSLANLFVPSSQAASVKDL